MYELIQLGESTYCMECPAKVGFYKTAENEVVLIDAGSDKDAAKKVKKILDGQGWQLKAILDTHSHADHIGGNNYLQGETGCKIYAPGIELAPTRFPILEPAGLYGANPLPELQNKFFLAKESAAEALTADILPTGMESIPLPGHSYDMVGFRTGDNVVFLADAISGIQSLEKYQINFLYDVRCYLDTLEKIKQMEGAWFVPAHGECTREIATLAQMNIDKVLQIADTVTALLAQPQCFEMLLARMFESFSLTMNLTQRMLVGSTLKAYLCFLVQQGKVAYRFDQNVMVWYAVA